MFILTLVTCIVLLCMTVVTCMLFMGAMNELHDGKWGELLISLCMVIGSSCIIYGVIATFNEALKAANY